MADMQATEGRNSHPAAASDVAAALETWRNGLVNLTAINRAINFKHSKSSTVEISGPDAQSILDGLRAGKTWSFLGTRPADEGREHAAPTPYTFRSPKDDKDLGAVLRTLNRKAKQEYLARGLSVLYVGLGMLRWTDTDDTAYQSPLLLIPVDLVPVGPRDTPRLEIGEDDPTLNPALALRLAEFGITLPGVDNLTD